MGVACPNLKLFALRSNGVVLRDAGGGPNGTELTSEEREFENVTGGNPEPDGVGTPAEGEGDRWLE